MAVLSKVFQRNYRRT